MQSLTGITDWSVTLTLLELSLFLGDKVMELSERAIAKENPTIKRTTITKVPCAVIFIIFIVLGLNEDLNICGVERKDYKQCPFEHPEAQTLQDTTAAF